MLFLYPAGLTVFTPRSQGSFMKQEQLIRNRSDFSIAGDRLQCTLSQGYSVHLTAPPGASISLNSCPFKEYNPDCMSSHKTVRSHDTGTLTL